MAQCACAEIVSGFPLQQMGRAECWSCSFLKGIHGTCCSCCCFWGGLPQNQCSLTIGTGVVLGFTASILLLAHYGCTFSCRVLREWMYSSLASLVCYSQFTAQGSQKSANKSTDSKIQSLDKPIWMMQKCGFFRWTLMHSYCSRKLTLQQAL